MRDQSLFLRVLVLAVLLLVATAVCVVGLVVTDALRPSVAHMGAAGAVILSLAVLGSAISALGPKYRPTPLLTPLFAGIFVALLATAGLYAAHWQLTSRHGAVAVVEAKPKLPAKPAPQPPAQLAPLPASAPTMPQAPATPASAVAPMEQSPATPPSFNAGEFTPPPPGEANGLAPPTTQAEAPSPPAAPAATEAQAPAAPATPALAEAPVPATPAVATAATDATLSAPAASDTVQPPVKVANVAEPQPADTAKKGTAATIPVPAAAPEEVAKQNGDQPINLTGGFDSSGPSTPPAAGPPMELSGTGAAPAHRVVIPPLPRIRPCGGAGPACP